MDDNISEKVLEVLRKKLRKFTGLDEVVVEFLKNGGEIIAKLSRKLESILCTANYKGMGRLKGPELSAQATKESVCLVPFEN